MQKSRTPYYTNAKSLCWDCANAVPSADGRYGCEWSRNYEPVEGWVIAEKEGKKTTPSVTVCECPKFAEEVPRATFLDDGAVNDLLVAMVKNAITEFGNNIAKARTAVERKDIYNAEEAVKELRSIKEWVISGCNGLVSREISGEMLKLMTDDCEPFTELDKRNVTVHRGIVIGVRRYLSNLAKASKDIIVANKVNDEAERDLKIIAGKDKYTLCPVCRKHQDGKICKTCSFKWRSTTAENAVGKNG